MVWTGAAMVLGVQLSMVPPVAAHDAPPDEGRVCNPVNHGDKIPVLTKDGRFVKHGGTADCPPPPAEPVAEPAPAPEPKVITIQGDVAFDLNKANIKPAFEPTLNEIADELNASPDTKLEVVGHADSTGTDAYNQGLSERRAQAVADYLVGRGVAADRFSVSGRGESEPVESNATREGRAKNRRVEIRSM
jgi:OOP family OmpA-OmpF porin